MSIQWLFSRNTFQLIAERSMKRYYKFVNFFIEALKFEQSNAKIAEIITNLTPFINHFNDAYALNKSQTGIRMGDTGKQSELFIKLQKEKMPDWYRRIAVVFPPKTSEFIKILPQGSDPINHSSFDERLVYLNNIIGMLNNYPVLEPIAIEMKQFKTEVENARKDKQQSSSGVKLTSDDLKIKAGTLASEIYGALGLLMYIHRNNPSNISKYFDLSLMHYSQKTKEELSDILEIKLAAQEIKEGGFSFTLAQKILLYNSGDTKLRFWFVPLPNSPMPTSYIDLEADTELEFEISKYANANDRFFMIQNLSSTDEGSVEIEFV